MYICGLIPQNFAELAEAVPIGVWVQDLMLLVSKKLGQMMNPGKLCVLKFNIKYALEISCQKSYGMFDYEISQENRVTQNLQWHKTSF